MKWVDASKKKPITNSPVLVRLTDDPIYGFRYRVGFIARSGIHTGMFISGLHEYGVDEIEWWAKIIHPTRAKKNGMAKSKRKRTGK